MWHNTSAVWIRIWHLVIINISEKQGNLYEQEEQKQSFQPSWQSKALVFHLYLDFLCPLTTTTMDMGICNLVILL